ncbi:MAG: hypothetical protein ACLTCM_10365 [Anaerovoracaceae bacterium]
MNNKSNKQTDTTTKLEQTPVKAKRNYKDSIFRKLFNNKAAIIDLYNALSGSDYPPDTYVKIVTLDNVIFGDRKNDLAFMIENRFIILIEMQSTVNPNMPLRFLVYIAKEFEKLFFSQQIYSSTLVKIPTPEIYVFYDGAKDIPLESELKLSDAFIAKCDKLYLDLNVRVINVNYEKGAELLEKCRLLSDYSQLVHIAKMNYQRTHDLDTAVSEAVTECMEKGILRNFLKENGGEIMSFLYDMLTKEEMEEIREHDGYVRGHADGVQEGKKLGIEEGHASGIKEGLARGAAERDRDIATNMLAMGMDIPVIAKATGLSEKDILGLRQTDTTK